MIGRGAVARGLGVALIASLAALAPRVAAAQAPAGGIGVNANPVRDASVTLTWPAGSGGVVVVVYSQLGTVVRVERIATDPGRYVWDLRTSSGEVVANGPYLLVVTRSDGTRWRRRLTVAR